MTPMRTRDLDAWAVYHLGGEGDNKFFFYYYRKNKMKPHNDDVYNARRVASLRVSSLTTAAVREADRSSTTKILLKHTFVPIHSFSSV